MDPASREENAAAQGQRAVAVQTEAALALARTEHPLAGLVDDLPALGEREGDRLVAARMGLGAHELMLLHAVGGILLDHSGGLVLLARAVGRRADAIALNSPRREAFAC